jgi:hypothetical protein
MDALAHRTYGLAGVEKSRSLLHSMVNSSHRRSGDASQKRQWAAIHACVLRSLSWLVWLREENGQGKVYVVVLGEDHRQPASADG